MRQVVLVGGPLDGFEVAIPEGTTAYKAVELDPPSAHELVYVPTNDGHRMLFEPIAQRRGIH